MERPGCSVPDAAETAPVRETLQADVSKRGMNLVTASASHQDG